MIRQAGPGDAGALMQMGKAFFDEAGHGEKYEFCPKSFAATLCVLLEHKLLIVAEDKGEVIGMAGADVSHAFWNHSVKMGREAFWYVRPGRRQGVGTELLAALETVSMANGATVFDVVAEDGKRDAALSRLYRRAGYRPAERVFRKGL